jgi:uncharacterized protein
MLAPLGASEADNSTRAELQPVALITGGSAGIGLAIAREFAAHGHDLLLVARDAGRLQAAALTLAKDFPVCVHLLALDIGAGDAVIRIDRELRASGLAVHWLVNNAGAWLSGATADSRSQDLESVLNTNVMAVHRITRAILPAMLQRGHGAILNVGSLAGMAPAPGFALYAASKAFLHSMTLALRQELRGTGVTVSLLAPGVVSTPFISGGNAGQSRCAWLQSSPETVAHSAYRGLMCGQGIIVPGLLWRLVRFGMRLVPARATASILQTAQSSVRAARTPEERVAPAAAGPGGLSMSA